MGINVPAAPRQLVATDLHGFRLQPYLPRDEIIECVYCHSIWPSDHSGCSSCGAPLPRVHTWPVWAKPTPPVRPAPNNTMELR